MKTHLGYWFAGAVLAAMSYFAVHSWLAEHDARLAADITTAEAKAQVKQLNTDMATIIADKDSVIAGLKKQKAEVKTPQQAITAIPTLVDLPINVRPDPTDATRATVDVLPLFQQLNQCKQDTVELNACKLTSEKKDEIIKIDEAEIVTLKKKPAFWKRMTGSMKSAGFWTSVGILVAKVVLK